ncbi:hypothetical protein E0Z10_g3310 [Xylaria hypoxylon]|uniref:F-box domain-containing protein n=1 Tax=Xylaria hypoxylon TaxID=37992 RepID=A0A4Z0Z134_9PEZI|nr:hypothetical protein E0Z10_g3310 [Xylaria hypoxylon]
MEQLPTELIGEVCGALCPHCKEHRDEGIVYDFMFSGTWQRQALVNLCLTSSKLRAIAQPFLYHRITIPNGETTHIVSLLDTLISRPDLARATKHIITPSRSDDVTINDEVLSRLTQAARRTGLRLPDDWAEDIACLPDRLMQQLILQVPHIELVAFLSVGLEPWDLLQSVDPFTRSLPALRKVVLDYWDTESGYDLSDMASLFSLATNVNRLSLYRCCDILGTLPLQNVTCLILGTCWIPADDMSRLLSSCGKLNTFAYDGSAYDVGEGNNGISANQLVHMLREQGHSGTLRRLYLDYSLGFQGEPESINSLDGFSQLQELYLGSVFIRWLEAVAADGSGGVLPASLKEIGLYGPSESMRVTLIWVVAQASEGFFPRLKRIRSDYGNGGDGGDDGAQGHLRPGLDHSGITYSGRGVDPIVGWA